MLQKKPKWLIYRLGFRMVYGESEVYCWVEKRQLAVSSSILRFILPNITYEHRFVLYILIYYWLIEVKFFFESFFLILSNLQNWLCKTYSIQKTNTFVIVLFIHNWIRKMNKKIKKELFIQTFQFDIAKTCS